VPEEVLKPTAMSATTTDNMTMEDTDNEE